LKVSPRRLCNQTNEENDYSGGLHPSFIGMLHQHPLSDVWPCHHS